MKKFRGCRFDPMDTRDLMFDAGLISLPKSVDNRKLAGTIKNQGAEGSCVGFSVAKTLEIALYKQINRQFNLSERWAYEYAKEYDEWPGNSYEGSSVRGGLKAANKLGVCEESFWPYKPNKRGKPIEGAAENASSNKVIKYTRIVGINNVKAAIYKYGAVAAAALVHEGWFSPNRNNGAIPMKPQFDVVGGHAFVLVGYGTKGFWIANSWGTTWGRRGFGVLLFNDAKLHLVDAWTLEMLVEDKIATKPTICDKCGRPL